MACENEIVQLSCNPYSRIAIYSASYGRTEYESIQCAQPQGVLEESKFILLMSVIFIVCVYMRVSDILKYISLRCIIKYIHFASTPPYSRRLRHRKNQTFPGNALAFFFAKAFNSIYYKKKNIF